jgi:hypothetical protein
VWNYYKCHQEYFGPLLHSFINKNAATSSAKFIPFPLQGFPSRIQIKMRFLECPNENEECLREEERGTMNYSTGHCLPPPKSILNQIMLKGAHYGGKMFCCPGEKLSNTQFCLVFTHPNPFINQLVSQPHPLPEKEIWMNGVWGKYPR